MREPFESLFPSLEERVRGLLQSHSESHGWDHTVRVLHNARHIAVVEKADAAVVEYASLLHDIGRAEEDARAGKGACHAEVGAARVPAILGELCIGDAAFITHVADCVRTHRYRRRDCNAPATLEAKIVFDADKLDSIGAIGIGRAFHFAGHVGARVHNTAAEAIASKSYSREDSALREFMVKLRHIREAMLTAEGRRLAEERHNFMCGFFEQIEREVSGEA